MPIVKFIKISFVIGIKGVIHTETKYSIQKMIRNLNMTYAKVLYDVIT